MEQQNKYKELSWSECLDYWWRGGITIIVFLVGVEYLGTIEGTQLKVIISIILFLLFPLFISREFIRNKLPPFDKLK